MLVHRLRRWPNIKPTCLLFTGLTAYYADLLYRYINGKYGCIIPVYKQCIYQVISVLYLNFFATIVMICTE